MAVVNIYALVTSAICTLSRDSFLLIVCEQEFIYIYQTSSVLNIILFIKGKQVDDVLLFFLRFRILFEKLLVNVTNYKYFNFMLMRIQTLFVI